MKKQENSEDNIQKIEKIQMEEYILVPKKVNK